MRQRGYIQCHLGFVIHGLKSAEALQPTSSLVPNLGQPERTQCSIGWLLEGYKTIECLQPSQPL
jgi:hypothetical protein